MTPISLPKNPILQRVRVEGVLEGIQADDASFRLRLPDGRLLLGHFNGRSFHGLARVLTRPLIVFGNGWFGATGQLEGVEADGFSPAMASYGLSLQTTCPCQTRLPEKWPADWAPGLATSPMRKSSRL